MKTKKMVYERIRLLKEYSEQLKELQSGILYDIYPYDNDTLERVTKELQALVAGERTPEEAIENIDSYSAFDNLEEGEDISLPSISIRYGGDVVGVSLTTKEGDSINAEICYADNCETVQASLGYTTNKGKANEQWFDLALAEIKKGELAKACKLPEDNRDIDIYVWADPHTDECTDVRRISHTDILEVLKSCEE